ncbi:hypothetical protein ACFFNA_36140, partial [Mesorhizobium kowhaii]|uniref:hypothetical protein n=1 Tax=Mesorhizobium kowhaii TaxID=1300272 RepID=UPI0035EF7FA2
RSRRYRQRCKNNVTHQSPPCLPDGSRLNAPLIDGTVALDDVTAEAVPSIPPAPCCRRCSCRLPPFFRGGFVRRRGAYVRQHDYGDPTDDHIRREGSDDPAPVPR